jgi:hypothetical protein
MNPPLIKKCKCGGTFAWDFENMGITHTYPTCKAYDDLDIQALLDAGEGQLALYMYAMEAKAEA